MGKRAKIIAEIERGLSQLTNQVGQLTSHVGDRPGLCLYYAHQVATVLWRHKYQAVIQAGSLQWPRIRREEDDGQINTHFAYEWTPHEVASAVSVAMGNLPEMHVWVGILDTQEIVDLAL